MGEHTINPLHVTSCNKHVCIQASAHFHLNIPYIFISINGFPWVNNFNAYSKVKVKVSRNVHFFVYRGNCSTNVCLYASLYMHIKFIINRFSSFCLTINWYILLSLLCLLHLPCMFFFFLCRIAMIVYSLSFCHQLKSLFPKRVKSTFGTSEKNMFL